MLADLFPRPIFQEFPFTHVKGVPVKSIIKGFRSLRFVLRSEETYNSPAFEFKVDVRGLPEERAPTFASTPFPDSSLMAVPAVLKSKG